jgi:hypothetical protein
MSVPQDKHQIMIMQAGSEVFAFDTITWPNNTFDFPIVYTAWAMQEHSYDAQRIGWKWINREQFEWLIRHVNCLVSYTGLASTATFFCNKHQCWERDGQDWGGPPTAPEEQEFYIEPDMDDERKI